MKKTIWKIFVILALAAGCLLVHQMIAYADELSSPEADFSRPTPPDTDDTSMNYWDSTSELAAPSFRADFSKPLFPHLQPSEPGKNPPKKPAPDLSSDCHSIPDACEEKSQTPSQTPFAAGNSSGNSGDADVDSDGDGIADDIDNCSGIENAGQEDADGDGIGDVCDQCDTPLEEIKGVDADGCTIELVKANIPTVTSEIYENNMQGSGCSMVPTANANSLAWLIAAAALIPIGIRRKR